MSDTPSVLAFLPDSMRRQLTEERLAAVRTICELQDALRDAVALLVDAVPTDALTELQTHDWFGRRAALTARFPRDDEPEINSTAGPGPGVCL